MNNLNLNRKINKLDLKDVLSTSYTTRRKYIKNKNTYVTFPELSILSNSFRKFEEGFHCLVWLCLSISINIIFLSMVWPKEESLRQEFAWSSLFWKMIFKEFE